MTADHGRGDRADRQTGYNAEAQASMVLCESILYALLEYGLLTKDQLLGTIEQVIEAKRQMIDEGDHSEAAELAAGLLATLQNSLAAVRRR